MSEKVSNTTGDKRKKRGKEDRHLGLLSDTGEKEKIKRYAGKGPGRGNSPGGECSLLWRNERGEGGSLGVSFSLAANPKGRREGWGVRVKKTADRSVLVSGGDRWVGGSKLERGMNRGWNSTSGKEEKGHCKRKSRKRKLHGGCYQT